MYISLHFKKVVVVHHGSYYFHLEQILSKPHCSFCDQSFVLTAPLEDGEWDKVSQGGEFVGRLGWLGEPSSPQSVLKH